MNITVRLNQVWQNNQSLLCIGIDPVWELMPEASKTDTTPFLAFSKAVIEATADLVCAYKFQFACFAAAGAEDQLQQAISWLKQQHPDVVVILDAKRGDIDTSAQLYAVEAFERYQADIVTVNPYLGRDGIEPFLQHTEGGVAVLCRNSNPSAAALQELTVLAPEPMPLYEKIARDALLLSSSDNLMLVMGATAPKAIARVRALTDEVPLLVPGVGAQGGDLQAVLQAGLTSQRRGLVISISRAIIFSADVRTAAQEYLRQIQHAIEGLAS